MLYDILVRTYTVYECKTWGSRWLCCFFGTLCKLVVSQVDVGKQHRHCYSYGRSPEPQESQGLEAALSQARPLFRLGSGNSRDLSREDVDGSHLGESHLVWGMGGLWRLMFSYVPWSRRKMNHWKSGKKGTGSRLHNDMVYRSCLQLERWSCNSGLRFQISIWLQNRWEMFTFQAMENAKKHSPETPVDFKRYSIYVQRYTYLYIITHNISYQASELYWLLQNEPKFLSRWTPPQVSKGHTVRYAWHPPMEIFWSVTPPGSLAEDGGGLWICKFHTTQVVDCRYIRWLGSVSFLVQFCDLFFPHFWHFWI